MNITLTNPHLILLCAGIAVLMAGAGFWLIAEALKTWREYRIPHPPCPHCMRKTS